MPTKEIAAEFDEISLVYDETRDPLDATTIEGLVGTLREVGAASVLEVGVGTGRVAKPLSERGIAVTGLDASRGMLTKARAKGLSRLVRGSAYRLPFPDGTFDSALFVHVLHVLDDPARAIREASRVGRRGTFALVHPPRRKDGEDTRREDEPRSLVREILREQGFPIPPRQSLWVKERDLLARFPPDGLVVVSEREVTELLRARIDRLAKRGHRNLLTIPPEALDRAIGVARERVGERTVTYTRVEALASWTTRRGETDPEPSPT
jgi:ubiquinone/menaquinone biosynthesis C-methylase UbiE